MTPDPRPPRITIGVLPAAATVLAMAVSGYALLPPDAPAAIDTVPVTGEPFVDRLEVRGEIRPVRSVVITAPMGSGELQIVTLVRSGTIVQRGDVVVQFDGTTLRRTVEDRETELRQAEAEVERAKARAATAAEQNQTLVLRARFDVDRARLDLANEELLAAIDRARARLALADAEQRLVETLQKVEADRSAEEAAIAGRLRQREKTADDLARARRSLDALEIRAPAAGTIHVLPNPRSGGPMGGTPQEFREGDRAWAGAPVAELPDLSAILLVAHIEEGDRGRLETGQRAMVRVDALPDRELQAVVADISVLARVNFGSGFPPPRQFHVTLRVEDEEPRLRPGMSATARIDVERIDGVLAVPAGAVFTAGGRTVVYRQSGAVFERVPVDVVRRGREQAAVASGVLPGDRVATVEPPDALVREPR